MFITFEGPDGSGKTTAIESLKKYLIEKGVDFILTREPGGANVKEAEALRSFILDNNNNIDNTTEAILYAASRRLNLESNIWPALKKGKLVMSDRYFDSSFVYQGYARGLGIDKIIELNDIATDKTYPDKTIYFDISFDQAKDRIGNRVASRDRLESAGEDFLKKVYEGYKIVSKKFSDRFIRIDASKSKEEVAEQLKKVFNELLGLE